MSKRLLKRENLEVIVNGVVGDGGLFVGPAADTGQVIYKGLTSADEITTDYIIPRNSAKDSFFPQTEAVAKFTLAGKNFNLESIDADDKERVIFGTRPCDAAAFASLRSVFTWEGFDDKSYTTREDNSVVISLACSDCDEECFCTTVDVSPEGTDGSDILLRETEEGSFLAEGVTEKGEEFMGRFPGAFEDGGDSLPLKPVCYPDKIEGVNVENIMSWLQEKTNFDDPVWSEVSMKCVGCGACTFSCPTCHCFDITDEGTTTDGERRKNWDACQFDHFTQHAGGGHNPRDTQSKRWRNRFMCKFEYYPQKFESKGCVGCGRCIRVCSVRHDITEVMESVTFLDLEGKGA